MKQFKRNELGLIEGVEYKYREDGTIDWRAMVNSKYLVINKSYEDSLTKRFGVALKDIPVADVEDNKLLILLQGIKELAILRGYKSITPTVTHVSDNKATVCTQIVWLPNFETLGQEISFGDVGSASLDSTSGFGQLYLESIASNRAFVRAVRNFLGVNIVASDEVDSKAAEAHLEKSKANQIDPHGPQAVLEKAIESAGLNFDTFKARVIEKYTTKVSSNPSEWTSLASIKPNDAFVLLTLLKKPTKV